MGSILILDGIYLRNDFFVEKSDLLSNFTDVVAPIKKQTVHKTLFDGLIEGLSINEHFECIFNTINKPQHRKFLENKML